MNILESIVGNVECLLAAQIKSSMKTIDDITDGVIAHQCNCMGYMGCGVALAIRTKYPAVV